MLCDNDYLCNGYFIDVYNNLCYFSSCINYISVLVCFFCFYVMKNLRISLDLCFVILMIMFMIMMYMIIMFMIRMFKIIIFMIIMMFIIIMMFKILVFLIENVIYNVINIILCICICIEVN